MKCIITILVLCGSINAFAQSNESNEYKEVAKTLNYYLEGGTNNDYKTLIKAFHKDADVKFVNDKKEFKTVKATTFFGKMKPGPKSSRKTRIANINISGHAANAHLVIEFPDFEFNDYMILLKVDGEWKIVTKIFHGEKKKFD